jgi:hypothetical protein
MRLSCWTTQLHTPLAESLNHSTHATLIQQHVHAPCSGKAQQVYAPTSGELHVCCTHRNKGGVTNTFIQKATQCRKGLTLHMWQMPEVRSKDIGTATPCQKDVVALHARGKQSENRTPCALTPSQTDRLCRQLAQLQTQLRHKHTSLNRSDH